MCARLAAKGVEPARIGEMRNRAEDAVRPLSAPSPYRAEWGLEDRKAVLYSGDVGAKQGIGIVLEAARRLREIKDLAFFICGDGPGMEALGRKGGDLANLVLRPLQPLDRLPELLALADLHLMPQLGAAADLVLPSKLANMLASGRPVVATAAAGTQLHAETAGCGLTTPPEDVAVFAAAIASLASALRMRASLGAAAAARARTRSDREAVIDGAEKSLPALAGLFRPDPAALERAEAALMAEAARRRLRAAAGA